MIPTPPACRLLDFYLATSDWLRPVLTPCLVGPIRNHELNSVTDCRHVWPAVRLPTLIVHSKGPQIYDGTAVRVAVGDRG